ncbi:MAG TPA: hypothetical protein VNV88_15865, partial [Candidatus Solibacter sp.]|nr:hypothetical protein [Candidatus Solibacter sp.]
IRFIRTTMERSSSFTAVPGWGMVVMGMTALYAAWMASRQLSPSAWLIAWLAEAALAICIGLMAMWRKAEQAGVPLTSGPAREFMFSFLPSAAAGGILTVALFRLGLSHMLPATWLLLYGAAVTSAGAFSLKVLPLMGVGFMLTGTVAVIVPAAFHSTLLAVGFGGLHIGFGYWIARRYGG